MDFDEPWPRWLENIAASIDSIATNPQHLEIFHRSLKNWAESRSNGRKQSRGRRDDPVALLPARAMKPYEKYATLAAIHDTVGKGVRRINPWRKASSFRGRQIGGHSFDVLCSRVRELNKDDHSRLIQILQEVRADIANAIPTSASIATPTNKLRPAVSSAPIHKASFTPGFVRKNKVTSQASRSLRTVGKAAAPSTVRSGNKIPSADRTRPLTLHEAAVLMGYKQKRRVEILSKSIRDGTIEAEKLNRQSYVFSKRSFPISSWNKLL